MLRKKLRLPINHFPKNGKVFFNGNLVTIKIVPNTLGYSRVGSIIGRGVVRRATQRNKIKRIIFNFFASEIDYLLDSSKDILVIFKHKNPSEYKDELIKELGLVLEKDIK